MTMFKGLGFGCGR